jgi:hypothetical protein
MHSVLIKGVPMDVPLERAQKDVSDMFYESYPNEIL